MMVSLYRLGPEAATGPRERARRERRGEQLRGVDPPEPERAAVEVEEHDVRRAARAEAFGERAPPLSGWPQQQPAHARISPASATSAPAPEEEQARQRERAAPHGAEVRGEPRAEEPGEE